MRTNGRSTARRDTIMVREQELEAQISWLAEAVLGSSCRCADPCWGCICISRSLQKTEDKRVCRTRQEGCAIMTNWISVLSNFWLGVTRPDDRNYVITMHGRLETLPLESGRRYPDDYDRACLCATISVHVPARQHKVGKILGIKNALKCSRVIPQPQEKRAKYDKELESKKKPCVTENAYP